MNACPVCDADLDAITGHGDRDHHVDECRRIEDGVAAAAAARETTRALQELADAETKLRRGR